MSRFTLVATILLSSVIILQAQTSTFEQPLSVDMDTVKAPGPTSVAVRSLVLPGWGQIRQEKLWKAAIFYATTATFYYRAAYHYHRYSLTDNPANKNEAVMDLSIALFAHGLNVLDGWSTAKTEAPKGWHAGLLSDNPVKSPWGATLRSAILPGWGQVYTESYWKAIGWAGLVTWLGYETYRNEQEYDRTGLEEYEDDRRRYAWYFGLAYLLMLTDAHVDAHLYKFDDAVRLAAMPRAGDGFIGVSLTVRW